MRFIKMLSEDPEEGLFLYNQLEEDHEHLERSKEEKHQQIEVLKAYLGSDYDKVKDVDEFAILNICGAMEDYALSKIADYEKL